VNIMRPLNSNDFQFEGISVCPICKSSVSELLYEKEKFGAVFSWRQCAQCGGAYQNPRLSRESLSKIYGSINFWKGREIMDHSLHIAGYEDYIAENRFRIKNERYKVKRISKRFVHLRAVLDIACGDGLFLKAAEEEGFETLGIEMSLDMAHYGRDHYGINIVHGDFEYHRLPEEGFDLITLWDADNIFLNPVGAFVKICKSLRSGGVFIMSFLDNRSFNRLFFNRVKFWRDCHSLYIHSKGSIRHLAQLSGFSSPTFIGARRYFEFEKIMRYIRVCLRKSVGPVFSFDSSSVGMAENMESWCLLVPVPGYYWAIMRKES